MKRLTYSFIFICNSFSLLIEFWSSLPKFFKFFISIFSLCSVLFTSLSLSLISIFRLLSLRKTSAVKWLKINKTWFESFAECVELRSPSCRKNSETINDANAMLSTVENEDAMSSAIKNEDAMSSTIENENAMSSTIKNENAMSSAIENENAMSSTNNELKTFSYSTKSFASL